MNGRLGWAVAAAVLLSGCAGGTDGSGAGAGPCTPSTQQAQMLSAVNEARAQARTCGDRRFAAAEPLQWNCRLQAAADAHAHDMAAHDFLSHTGSDGLELVARVEAQGYDWRFVAENIAAGREEVDAVTRDWLGSAGHCANIMAPEAAEFGGARAANPETTYRYYWVQVFGRR